VNDARRYRSGVDRTTTNRALPAGVREPLTIADHRRGNQRLQVDLAAGYVELMATCAFGVQR